MSIWAIGDVQGCDDELELLLETLNFDPARDQAWFVGDLVNRGPKSLETLRRVKSLGAAAICVLGNHDLHLLALAVNAEAPVADDWLQPVLDAPDNRDLLDWLRNRPLAYYDAGLNTLMVHAGIAANWSVDDTLDYAAEVEQVLRGNDAGEFLIAMYGSKPTRWTDQLEGIDRLRFITNCLTRIRYSTLDGRLDFSEKLAPGTQPDYLLPWFDLPDRATGKTRIVFGHWSTLGLVQRPNLIATDTGCVWGGSLTAVRLDADAEPVQINSRQSARFGS
jgi:bis(5'-nucleosyl)-tetraphosphatase (symmetrical)